MPDDLTDFVSARWPALVRSAVLLGCSVPDAEDLAQTALVRCVVHWPRVSRADDRDAYVYRVLVNAHTDSRRRRWWRELPSEDIGAAVGRDATVDVAERDPVRRALASLSLPLRQAVVLRYYADLSERQVAEALDIAPGTVKSRLSRALAALATDVNFAPTRREDTR